MTTPGHGGTNDQGIAGPGGVYLDQYVLLELLNDSRRGAIYKAKHRTMGRTVAIKFLSDEAARSRQFTERFRRATKILALLEHQNLVRAHEAGEQGTTHYLIMEYIDGENLNDLSKSEGTLPIPKAIDYALQAAEGLAYAHDHGVVHRNIKPSKLVLDGQGVVKIVGFGLAHIDKDGALAQDDDAESLTIQGQVLGSYEYMPPEQAADAKQAGATAIGWRDEDLNKENIAAVHAAGLKCWAYTINDRRRGKQLIEAGIDGLITDDPAYMHGLLGVLSGGKGDRKAK